MVFWLVRGHYLCAFVTDAGSEIRSMGGSSRNLFAMPFSPRRLGSVAYSLVMFAIVSVLAAFSLPVCSSPWPDWPG